jgi:hypothetical protein
VIASHTVEIAMQTGAAAAWRALFAATDWYESCCPGCCEVGSVLLYFCRELNGDIDIADDGVDNEISVQDADIIILTPEVFFGSTADSIAVQQRCRTTAFRLLVIDEVSTVCAQCLLLMSARRAT